MVLVYLMAALVISGDAAAHQVRAVATIKPVHSLLAAVIGEAGPPATLLIDGMGSPHTYALKPSDARALNQAQLVVRVSDSLESFMVKVLTTLPANVKVVTLDQIPGLTLLPMRQGGLFEAHDHSHKGSAAQKGHRHDAAKSKGGSGEAIDGHLWLDPENAKKVVVHLADVLGGMDPARSADYKANASAAITAIDAAAGEADAKLASLKGRPFVVFHDAYQYFETRFGVPAIGSVTLSPDVQPSAKRLAALRARIQKAGAACVFSEPQFEPKLVATIIEGSSAKSGVLDPNGADIPAGPQQYPTLIRRLAQSLHDCLGGAS